MQQQPPPPNDDGGPRYPATHKDDPKYLVNHGNMVAAIVTLKNGNPLQEWQIQFLRTLSDLLRNLSDRVFDSSTAGPLAHKKAAAALTASVDSTIMDAARLLDKHAHTRRNEAVAELAHSLAIAVAQWGDPAAGTQRERDKILEDLLVECLGVHNYLAEIVFESDALKRKQEETKHEFLDTVSVPTCGADVVESLARFSSDPSEGLLLCTMEKTAIDQAATVTDAWGAYQNAVVVGSVVVSLVGHLAHDHLRSATRTMQLLLRLTHSLRRIHHVGVAAGRNRFRMIARNLSRYLLEMEDHMQCVCQSLIGQQPPTPSSCECPDLTHANLRALHAMCGDVVGDEGRDEEVIAGFISHTEAIMGYLFVYLEGCFVVDMKKMDAQCRRLFINLPISTHASAVANDQKGDSDDDGGSDNHHRRRKRMRCLSCGTLSRKRCRGTCSDPRGCYCCRECQRRDWRRHRDEDNCRKIPVSRA